MSLTALAQPRLRINSVVASPEDTIYWNNNQPIIHYTMVVENWGNSLLTGACSIKFQYNQWPAEVSKKIWQATNFEVGQLDTIEFNDTILNLSSQRYKGGDNIIVIWPHSDSPTQVPDTTRDSIYVTDMTGVRDPEAVAARVELYPNPTSDMVNVHYLDSRARIECVRILGLDGKVQFQSNRPENALDLSSLSPGLYFVEFKFRDGIYGALRVSKQ